MLKTAKTRESRLNDYSYSRFCFDAPRRSDFAAALLKNRLYRRWGIKTAREYARIKIDGRSSAATRTSPTRPGTATNPAES